MAVKRALRLLVAGLARHGLALRGNPGNIPIPEGYTIVAFAPTADTLASSADVPPASPPASSADADIPIPAGFKIGEAEAAPSYNSGDIPIPAGYTVGTPMSAPPVEVEGAQSSMGLESHLSNNSPIPAVANLEASVKPADAPQFVLEKAEPISNGNPVLDNANTTVLKPVQASGLRLAVKRSSELPADSTAAQAAVATSGYITGNMFNGAEAPQSETVGYEVPVVNLHNVVSVDCLTEMLADPHHHCGGEAVKQSQQGHPPQNVKAVSTASITAPPASHVESMAQGQRAPTRLVIHKRQRRK